jgi:uncharacterized ion transporter superfamily protein YfcC
MRIKIPHTLVLLFGMILVAQVLTWVLPQGKYERFINSEDREEVVADSYHGIEGAPRLPPQAFLTSIPRGFEAAADIIFFVFLIGGAFGVFRASGAADALIGFLLGQLGGRPNALIFGGVLLFAIGSSTIGMAEEYLPFVPILVALCLALGYDRLTAVGILCVGYSVGYGCAALNPFTVLIAQDVAGLPPTSGLWYRLVIFLPFLLLGFLHVRRYTRRIEREPEFRVMAEGDAEQAQAETIHPELNSQRRIILGMVALAIAGLVWGIQQHHWYLEEMGAIFVGLALLISLVARMGPSRTATEFCLGAGELTTTALLVGFARTIQVILDDGQVVDTIIHGVAQPLAQMGAVGAGVGMFFFQSLCNLFIPSGSGQAFVTMPLMAPLADLVGVSRQVAVLAYQFGDGFTNIVVPTNAVLVGILAMAKVPLDRWFRFIMPFMIQVWILGSLALAVAVWLGYS